jgi:pantoate--beta-alanine ligase
MKVLTTVKETRELVSSWKSEALRVGLVPTMGSLHPGHGSLVSRALAENDRVIVSVFVNPIQFAPGEDLRTYPRDFEKDRVYLEYLQASAAFYPAEDEMYPPGFGAYAEVPVLSATLCGKHRPTHFRGVCTVVLKLFNIVSPDRAYFGLKDAQQFFVLRRMVRDFNLNIVMVPCPIVREDDGLALSSRNLYLSPEERAAAPVLHRALEEGRALFLKGEKDPDKIISRIREIILSEEPNVAIEYVEAVSTETLQPAKTMDGEILVALAARLGKTRLIDNFVLMKDMPN